MAGQAVSCRKCGRKMRLPGAAGKSVTPAAPAKRGAEPAKTPSPQYLCGVCGRRFGIENIYNQQGSIICKECFARQPATISAPVCAGCGAVVRPDDGQTVGGRLLCPTCAMSEAAQAATSASFQGGFARKTATRKTGVVPWIIGSVVAAGVVVVAAVVIHRAQDRQVAHQVPAPQIADVPATAPAPPQLSPEELWELKNHDKLAALRQDAKDLEAAGDFSAASDKYRQLLELAGAAPQPTPAIQSQMSETQAAWKAVIARLATTNPAAVALVTAPIASPTHPPDLAIQWEPQHRQQIEGMLAEIQTHRASPDKLRTALAYQQLFDLVGPHTNDIHDDALKARLQAAAVDRAKLLTQVKASPEAAILSAKTLLTAGIDAMQRQRWKAALELLADARTLYDRNIKQVERVKDSDYLLALHTMAVAYLQTRQVQRAGELFTDDAQPLCRQLTRDPTRELVINRSVVDILQHTRAVRAAKTIKDYLDKHPTNADQTMLDLFFTAIVVGNQHAAGKSFLAQCEQDYEKLNAELEKTRPGEERWGVQWFAASEAERKKQEQRKAIATAQDLSRRAQAALGELHRQQQLFIPSGPDRTRHTTQAKIDAAQKTYDDLAAAADDAWKRIPDPPCLTEPVPVLPFAATISVASAPPGDLFNSPSTKPPGEGAPQPQQSVATNVPATPLPAPPAARPPVAPPRHALAFAVDRLRLISSAQVIGDATDVRLADSQGSIYAAKVIAKESDLALLEIDPSQLAGAQLRYLNLAQDFAGGPVQCAAIPQENIFGPEPKLLTGTAAAPPAGGEWSASLSDHPRLPASPLLNSGNELVGVVFPLSRDDVRTNLHAVTLAQLRAFLSAHDALPAEPCPSPDPTGVFELTAFGE